MKTGRNDPCPCGSGRKYKKCCGVSARSYATQHPQQPDLKAIFDTAWLHFQNGQFQQAAALYQRILALQPRNVNALHMLGGIATKTGRLPLARQLLEQAIAINPGRADIHNNLGYVLTDLRKPEEAEITLTRAINLKPDYSEAYLNRACVYKILGRIGESIADSETSIRLNPDSLLAYTNLLYVMNCSDSFTAQDIFEKHVSFGRLCQSRFNAEISHASNTVYTHKRLRIGYISPDFRTHSVAYFIEPVLKQHNKEKFEVYGYHNSHINDQTTLRIRGYCDHWRTTATLDDSQLVNLIRNDEIDILVDLAGHTSNSRLVALIHKPAPVLMTWLGYPNTTGLDAIDYHITDEVADPSGLTDRWYTEEQLRLPDCFLCYRPGDSCPDIINPPSNKSGYVTFGSFNNLGKFSVSALSAWAAILHAVPHSKLLLKNAGLTSEQRCASLLDHFHELGIEPDRIALRGNDPTREEHLERYGEIDIALDTFPYNGTTTTCESLWMGVPVVTYAGESHRDRVGASLLHALGLDELVGTDTREYINIATTLARNTSALADYRMTLRNIFRNSPLMDAQRFTKNLEHLYSCTALRGGVS